MPNLALWAQPRAGNTPSRHNSNRCGRGKGNAPSQKMHGGPRCALNREPPPAPRRWAPCLKPRQGQRQLEGHPEPCQAKGQLLSAMQSRLVRQPVGSLTNHP
eukprot:2151105-Alexandrium_andersonii.AAC.1